MVSSPSVDHPFPSHGQCESCPINRDIKLTQEEGKGPDVVIVTVGQDDSFQLVPILHDMGKVGQKKVNTREVSLGKLDPGIDEDE